MLDEEKNFTVELCIGLVYHQIYADGRRRHLWNWHGKLSSTNSEGPKLRREAEQQPLALVLLQKLREALELLELLDRSEHLEFIYNLECHRSL